MVWIHKIYQDRVYLQTAKLSWSRQIVLASRFSGGGSQKAQISKVFLRIRLAFLSRSVHTIARPHEPKGKKRRIEIHKWPWSNPCTQAQDMPTVHPVTWLTYWTFVSDSRPLTFSLHQISRKDFKFSTSTMSYHFVMDNCNQLVWRLPNKSMFSVLLILIAYLNKVSAIQQAGIDMSCITRVSYHRDSKIDT